MSAVETLLRRFATVFGPPNTPEPAAFVAEYRRALSFYDNRPDVLDRVASDLIDGQEMPFWPAVGKVRKHAEKIAGVLYSQQHASRRREEDQEVKEPTGPFRVSDEKREELNRLVQDAVRKMRGGEVMTKSFELRDVSRPAFERMQRESPNGMHRELTSRSRAMAGEGE